MGVLSAVWRIKFPDAMCLPIQIIYYNNSILSLDSRSRNIYYVTKHRFYLVMAQGPCFLKSLDSDFCRRAQSPETQAQPSLIVSFLENIVTWLPSFPLFFLIFLSLLQTILLKLQSALLDARLSQPQGGRFNSIFNCQQRRVMLYLCKYLAITCGYKAKFWPQNLEVFKAEWLYSLHISW